jgi:hypothetical protein
MPGGITQNEKTASVVYSYNKVIYVQTPEISSGQIRIFTLSGQEVFNAGLQSGVLNKFVLDFQTGYYIVQVITGMNIKSNKVFIP